MPDEGTGSKTVWRVESMELVEVDQADHGFLYSGDCYVILYSYGDSGKIVYFWQGEKCSIDERGASAIHAARIDNEELGGRAIQVRVVQGQEPRHFIKMFAGNMIVLQGQHLSVKLENSSYLNMPGGKKSGFRNASSAESGGEAGDSRVFRVQCVRGEQDARATQVSPSIANMRSDDVFILSSRSEVLVWKGSSSNAAESVEGERLAAKLYPDLPRSVVQQGQEPSLFWSILGAEPGTEIADSEALNAPVLSSRLFHVTAKRAFEISDFKRDVSLTFKQNQLLHLLSSVKDLVGDDVMLLDSGDEVYLWIGEESEPEEVTRGQDLAKQYLNADPTQR